MNCVPKDCGNPGCKYRTHNLKDLKKHREITCEHKIDQKEIIIKCPKGHICNLTKQVGE